MIRCVHWSLRFIPTSVGNAGHEHDPRANYPVHPHVCGERLHMFEYKSLCRGSSPRLWGTLDNPCSYRARCRFIPTSVGNAFFALSGTKTMTVHPHVCGERCSQSRRAPLTNGSSPRLWGTPGNSGHDFKHERFIPTSVGNATVLDTRTGVTSVHPHVCGERHGGRRRRGDPCGSSPRLWGTLISRPG